VSIREAATVIHLGGGLLRALKRPTRRLSRARQAIACRNRASDGPSWWRLPIWSCTTESLPSHSVSPPVLVGSYIKPCGPTVSPITWSAGPCGRAAIGWSVLCCTCRRVAPPGR